MLASERLLEIEEKFEVKVERIVPVELDEEALRVILYLKDGTNLRVTEQWAGKVLKRYSYYWLNSAHHKHVGKQGDLQASAETCLEEVMGFIQREI
jgi:hypothetical protein